jgi:hypothetical protein
MILFEKNSSLPSLIIWIIIIIFGFIIKNSNKPIRNAWNNYYVNKICWCFSRRQCSDDVTTSVSIVQRRLSNCTCVHKLHTLAYVRECTRLSNKYTCACAMIIVRHDYHRLRAIKIDAGYWYYGQPAVST